MTEERPKSHSSNPWPLLLIPLGLVLYVATAGPVARFVRTHSIDHDSMLGTTLSIIYWPIEFLANWSPTFAKFLMWYIEFFVP